MITLVTNEGHRTEVDEGFLEDSTLLSSILEELQSEFIPLPNVSKVQLDKIVGFYRDGIVPEWSDEIIDIMLAVDYLGMEVFLDELAKVTAEHLKGKSPEYIRRIMRRDE